MIFDLQRASLLKRISAFMLDAIVLVIAITGLSALFSVLLDYDAYEQTLQDAYARYEAEYNISFDLSNEEYMALSEDKKAVYDKAYEAMNKDEDALYAYNMVVRLNLTVTSLAIVFSFLIFEFLIPLWLKNGQTLGKKIFGIAVMREDGVRLSTLQLFARSMLGKCTIGTMIPFLMLFLVVFGSLGATGTMILFAMLALQAGLMFTKRRTAIHDLLAHTVAVDMASQMIFDTTEEMIEYKKRVSAEKAANQTY